jgi:hypothetical protein
MRFAIIAMGGHGDPVHDLASFPDATPGLAHSL